MKNFLRFVIPSMLILGGIIAFAIAANTATNVQTWHNAAGTAVAGVDTNGSYNCNAAISTSTSASSSPTISNNGTITFAEPFDGTYYKKAIIGCTTVITSATTTFTFPVAFTYTPILTSGTSAGQFGTLTPSTTSVTMASTTASTTGVIVVEGQ
jgi:hypothetical protein